MKFIANIVLILWVPLYVLAQANGKGENRDVEISFWEAENKKEYENVFHFGDSEGETYLAIIIVDGQVYAQLKSGIWSKEGDKWINKYENFSNVKIEGHKFYSDETNGDFVVFEIDNKLVKGLKVYNPWNVDSNEEYEIGIQSYEIHHYLKGKFPQASYRNISIEELRNLSLQELKIMRNEIFARHGYIFISGGQMDIYFKKQKWYQSLHKDVKQLLSDIERDNIKLIQIVEKEKKSIPLDQKIQGQWINLKYYHKLKETNSPRESQNASYISFIDFKKNKEALIVFNFHEGLTPMYYIKDDTIKFDFGYTMEAYCIYRSENALVLKFMDNIDTLIKHEIIGSNQLNLVINKIVFEGEYIDILRNSKVEFFQDGRMSGIENFRHYRAVDNYYDPGMDVDLVEFIDRDKKERYTWLKSGDTLRIYSLKCIEFDSTYNYCLEIEKSELKYLLQKTH